MKQVLSNLNFSGPELIFGLVGPIGVNLDAVQKSLTEELNTVGYYSSVIHLTKLLDSYIKDNKLNIDRKKKPSTASSRKIDSANRFRKYVKSNAALAGIAISAIQLKRESTLKNIKDNSPFPKTAYIIRQFKTIDEINLVRKTYGRQFIQISVHADHDERVNHIASRISSEKTDLSYDECKNLAYGLMTSDLNERDNKYGQRVEKIFHLGDVFIDGNTLDKTNQSVKRFVRALFGDNSISPTKDEYSSYIAFSASYRSLDLSRQVGAAIFTKDGDVITLGSNEVPKFGGGTYWHDDPNKSRDFDIGSEKNKKEKDRIATDVLLSLKKDKKISKALKKQNNFKDSDLIAAIKSSLIADITEYGRMVHAEMNAICDAAKLGKSIKGCTIYVTTFPCHNCAKHIIASGIDRVVFIQPYPKSRAAGSYLDSITFDKFNTNKVLFEHFVGISYRRFRDIFEKGSRTKNSTGEINEWYEEKPWPRIEVSDQNYLKRNGKDSLSEEDKGIFESLKRTTH